MAIKAADTLKPNGSFALAEAADIDINGQSLTDYLADLSAGTGIKSVTTAAVEDGTVVTITLNDKDATATVFTVKNGQNGQNGAKGTGIKSVTSEAVSGGNAVTIALDDTDETKTVFKVLDGQQGKPGDTGPRGFTGTGIKSVTTETVKDGTSVTVTLNDSKETKTVFTVKDGESGASCHATITETTDDDGTKHAYLKVWDGEDDSAAVTSPDLMVQVNEVLAAVEEIMGSYTGSATE